MKRTSLSAYLDTLEVAVGDTLIRARRRAHSLEAPRERALEKKAMMLGRIHALVVERQASANITFKPTRFDHLLRRLTLLSCGAEELVRLECRDANLMLEFHTELIDTVISETGPNAMNDLFRVLVDARTMGPGSIEF